jgi:alginate O-acetyltransferase complex protein AlgI
LFVGVFFNLGLLGYYKYANFFVENINAIKGTEIVLDQIILAAGDILFHLSADCLSG